MTSLLTVAFQLSTLESHIYSANHILIVSVSGGCKHAIEFESILEPFWSLLLPPIGEGSIILINLSY